MASVDLCHRVNPRGGLGLMAVCGGGDVIYSVHA